MSNDSNIEFDSQRYLDAMHAVQSGVAAKMAIDPKDTEPKHLRVGVSSALIEHGALVKLLIDKGVITLDEIMTYIADAAEQEVKSYEESLSAHYGGIEIKLK